MQTPFCILAFLCLLLHHVGLILVFLNKKYTLFHSNHCTNFVSGQDQVDETLEEFEEEFGEFTTDPEEEKEWRENLEKTEEEINEQNKKYNAGESGYFDKLNEFSELSDDEFEKEKTGYLPQPDDARETNYFATGHIAMPARLSRKISM